LREASLELDGINWSYVEAGSGPLLLLFHGTLSYKEAFAEQVAGLSDAHRVLAFDWPGHGGSGFDPAGWTVEDLVDAVPRLIEALGASSAAIGGFSQGGAISMRVAIEHPDRVDALVVMNAGLDPVPAAAVEAMAALGELLATGGEDERRTALEAHQAKFLHAPGWIEGNPEAAAEEVDRMLAHPRAAARSVVAIPAGYHSIEEEVGGIELPTLVIWGERDVRAAWGPRMEELIPKASLRVIPEAGHHLTLDAPERVTEAIDSFLDEVDA